MKRSHLRWARMSKGLEVGYQSVSLAYGNNLEKRQSVLSKGRLGNICTND